MASPHRDEISRLELLHAAHPDGLVFPHLADAYRRAGRYAQAESVLNTGLRRHSDYSSAHVVLGRLRLDQGKYEDAERAFLRVLELDPQNHVALDYLGRLSLEQGRLTDALAQFRRLSRLKPDEEVEQRIRELEHRVAELRDGVPPRKRGNGSVRRATNGGASEAAVAEVEPRPPRRPDPGSAEPAEAPPIDGPAGPDQPDTEAAALSGPGEVVTETMAELYARQGLTDHAAAVYRRLLERDPGNARLRDKLDSVGGAPTAEGTERPQPPVSARPAEQPTIRTQLGAVLAWRPAGSADPGSVQQAHGRASKRGSAAAELPNTPREEAHAAHPAALDLLDEASREASSPWTDPPAAQVAGFPASPGPAGARGDRPPEEQRSGETDTVRLLIAVTDMLVGLLEYRDPFFRGSSSLTRLMAEQVAEELGLDAEQRTELSLAAILRDLGRLALGGRLVSFSGSDTPEARRRIERHVDLALNLLEGIDLPAEARLAVRHHHERWDGAGYPDGLAGNEIPLLARILAVVDSFTAMVSPRSYRLPRKLPDAARELRDAAGTQYDPAVVDALLRVLARRDQPTLGAAQRPHVLLVDPDQPGAVVTAAKLCTAGYLAEVSGDPAAARERLRRVPVAAVVVSAEAGEEELAAFVRELRVDPSFSALPVVAVDAATVSLRVRLLESGADVCFPPGTTHAELQGTLGALVRRTMRSGRAVRAVAGDGETGEEAPWLALQGDVADFPLTWLLQVMKYDSRTAAIGIRAASADGAIYLQNGDAVHAQIRGGAKGEAALKEMLKWPKGRFTVQPEAKPRERTIEASIMHLLLTQAVDQDHAAAGIFGAVSD